MKRLFSLFIAVLAPLAASTVTTDTWNYVDGSGPGPDLFRITTVFTSAAELGGTDNRYQYSVEDLSADLTAVLFRVANPTNLAGALSCPGGWSVRTGAVNFICEGGTIAPGGTLAGFQILTAGLLPQLTAPPFPIDDIGWIETRNGAGARVDVFGPLTSAVPEPSTVTMSVLGSLVGLSATRLRRRRNSN